MNSRTIKTTVNIRVKRMESVVREGWDRVLGGSV
jgi:hypothetical protein